MNIRRFIKKRVYLDYASLTPVDPKVIREMKKYSGARYANPSSLYQEGVNAKKALEGGRRSCATSIGSHPDEIVFTSGGTEANSLALIGTLRAAKKAGFEKPHLIISSIEHSSIMQTADELEREGVEVTRLGVDKAGIVSVQELKKALKPNTYLVSIMMVNNEIGSIEPIHRISKALRQFRSRSVKKDGNPYPLFHTDASQAVLYSEINTESLGVDLLTLDGAKIYGPRGMGLLYVRRHVVIEPVIHGGGQEKGLRSGTENVPSVMGMAKALGIAVRERPDEAKRLAELKGMLMAGLMEIDPKITANGGGSVVNTSPHILNVSIPGIDSEYFVLRLDAAGFACSTKSSCLRDADESYVLKAIGAESANSIRFSFGRSTRKSDIKSLFSAISEILGTNDND